MKDERNNHHKMHIKHVKDCLFFCQITRHVKKGMHQRTKRKKEWNGKRQNRNFISTRGVVNGFHIDFKGAHNCARPHHELPRMNYLELREFHGLSKTCFKSKWRRRRTTNYVNFPLTRHEIIISKLIPSGYLRPIIFSCCSWNVTTRDFVPLTIIIIQLNRWILSIALRTPYQFHCDAIGNKLNYSMHVDSLLSTIGWIGIQQHWEWIHLQIT